MTKANPTNAAATAANTKKTMDFGSARGSLSLPFKVFHYIMLILVGVVIGVSLMFLLQKEPMSTIVSQPKEEYWLKLHRKSQVEFLYKGNPGDTMKSRLIKTFNVKTGRPGERPTPLPQALGKKYWKIVKKYPTENPETIPYFLELDVPIEDEVFGPVPYNECNGVQCFWALPGYFGLHGVNGDNTRLSNENPGSSGCIRHTDEDITYLYNLLEVDEGVRYYIEDI